MMERTLARIKPDVVRNKRIGSIISIIESHDFTIQKIKLTDIPTDTLSKLYAEHKDKDFYSELIKFMQSGKALVLILEKENAIADWRSLMGATNPSDAKPGTIRYMFGNKDPKRLSENATHGSDGAEAAKAEISLFFNCGCY